MKIHNYSAGPCILPQEVFEKSAQAIGSLRLRQSLVWGADQVWFFLRRESLGGCRIGNQIAFFIFEAWSN